MNSLEKIEAELTAHQSGPLAKSQRALDKHDVACHQQEDLVQREQAALNALRQRAAPLHAALADDQRKDGALKEKLLEQLVIHACSAAWRLHSADPIEHDAIITAAAATLKTAWRSGLDTPGGQATTPALVRQVVALAPTLDDINRPVYELGGAVTGLTDWPSRRDRLIPEIRQMLADLNKLLGKVSTPLEAA